MGRRRELSQTLLLAGFDVLGAGSLAKVVSSGSSSLGRYTAIECLKHSKRQLPATGTPK